MVFNYSNLVPGFYFDRFSPARQPLFFSYRRHVLQHIELFPENFFRSYRTYNNSGNLELIVDDLRIIGDPGKYNIGYVVAARLDDGTIDCSWKLSNQTIDHRSALNYVWIDPGFIIQFPIFIVAVVLISLPIIFCQNRFDEETVRLTVEYTYEKNKEEEEEEEDKGEEEVTLYVDPLPKDDGVKDENAVESYLQSMRLGALDIGNNIANTASTYKISVGDKIVDVINDLLDPRDEIEGIKKMTRRGRQFIDTTNKRYLEMIRTLLFTKDVQLIQVCGNDAYYFIRFSLVTIFTMFALLFVSIPAAVLDLVSSDYPYFKDFAYVDNIQVMAFCCACCVCVCVCVLT